MANKYINFGVGWLKTSQKGNSFISVVTKSKDKDSYEEVSKAGEKTSTKVWVQVGENGEPQLVSGFMVFPTDKPEGSKGPDYRLTLALD